MGTTLKDVERLALELMNSQWDFEDLHGGPRSINIMKDLDYKFEFDNSKRRFGCCCVFRSSPWADVRRWISLSKPLCSINLDKLQTKIKDTILHEIAHALAIHVNPSAPAHGRLWEHIAKQIGCDGRRCYNDEEINTIQETKYTLSCPVCDYTRGMHKRPKRDRACNVCCTKHNFGRYSEKYKLIIKQNY